MHERNAHQSVAAAVAAGTVYINVPALMLTVGPVLLVGRYFSQLSVQLGSDNRTALLGLIALVAGFAAGWCWWAYTVPKWRIWAYERVTDIDALDQWAINVGLTWPNGSFFARTEFKSPAQAVRERELAAAKRAPIEGGDNL
jgi:hypothetical protein